MVEPDLMLLRRICQELPRFAYRFGSETELHAGIDKVLTDAGIAFQREFVAGPKDRFDFLCSPGIVIEAKIHGSFSEALQQCKRYAEREDVSAVIVVASRSWAGSRPLKPDAKLCGKPLRLVQVRGMTF